MKEKANKNIDHFVDKVMKSSSLETPSFDFTSKVMSQVMATSKSTSTVYKPLFSKGAWVIMVLLAAGIIGFSVYSNDSSNINWLDKLDLSAFNSLFSGVKISQTTMYSMLMFAVMLFIQVPILKHYFNKRMEA